MARYTPEFVRALRQRYENTDQVMTSIAAEFEIGTRTLQRMVMTEGWRKRSHRTRGLPIAVGLLEQAKALAAITLPPQSGGEGRRAPEGASRGGGSSDQSSEAPPTPDPSPPPAARVEGGEQSPSAIDRIEALVVKEIEAEEAARAQLIGKRRMVGGAERSARTLATLTQTLHALQRLRAGSPPEQESLYDDDMPRDIDEFRRDLARRIDAFVASRTDAADADGDCALKPVDEAG